MEIDFYSGQLFTSHVITSPIMDDFSDQALEITDQPRLRLPLPNALEGHE
jgi:hypothetical protein